ncbi:MAG: ribosome biogenesis GTPase Der, partial [Candidatus Margulisbacteria bacterium]|nr:ribosome biogenesis GTPase Der [Candidatus Margulisiibacteriota bacterium]
MHSVVIVGRPNVGKSALFNRLCGKSAAIVDNRPGVTRDRIYETVRWKNTTFHIIDTGGLFFNRRTESLSADFQLEIELQVDLAIQQASLVLFMVDNKIGISPLDIEIAHKLRSFNKLTIIIANKVDHPDQELDSSEFYNLSMGEVIPISAKHGLNIGNLLDQIVNLLPKKEGFLSQEEPAIKIAILGRPNVGKSSLYNVLVNEDRSIVSDIPGTTHDAIDSDILNNDQLYRFIDTAGIRQKKKIDTRIEAMSINQARYAIERADICILMLDPKDGVTKQDQIIASLIARAGKACLIVLNKCDLIDQDHLEAFEAHIFDRLDFIDYAPLISIAAKKKENTSAIFPLLQQLHEIFIKKIPTPELNKFLQKAIQEKAPPSPGGKNAKLNYIA